MLRSLVTLLALMATTALSGCALPPAVTAVSVALDGVSYVSSGRSVTDHALSVVAAQDCMLLRVVEGEWVCRDFAEGEETFWVAESLAWAKGPEIVGMIAADGTPERETPVGSGDAAPPRTRMASNQDPAPAASPEPAENQAASMAAAATPRRSEGVVMVLGSFRDPSNAERLASRHADIAPRVSRTRLDDGVFYRVVVGPFSDSSQEKNAHRRLKERGVTAVWKTRECATSAPGSCAAAG